MDGTPKLIRTKRLACITCKKAGDWYDNRCPTCVKLILKRLGRKIQYEIVGNIGVLFYREKFIGIAFMDQLAKVSLSDVCDFIE